MDDVSDVMNVVRLWRKLVAGWREAHRAARGEIEAALIEGAPPDALLKTAFYLAFVAERQGIDSSNLLAFLNRPDLGESLDAAIVVVQRIALTAPVSAVPSNRPVSDPQFRGAD